MLISFARLILLIFGWKVVGGLPEGLKKCVLIVAPHTSNWDFIIGRMAFAVLGIRARFLIKKEIFKPYLAPVIRRLGGIPVDRSKSSQMVEQVAALFDRYDSLYVVITPEGTRKLVTNWKRGFYYIALKANVPIALGYLDYKEKKCGIGQVMTPSGDFNKDFPSIESFYRGRRAKYPEKFNLS